MARSELELFTELLEELTLWLDVELLLFELWLLDELDSADDELELGELLLLDELDS